jgi:DNA-binding beta-propeller fold protein YncE
LLGTIRDIVSDGTHVWVVNGAVGTPHGRRGDTVTQLNASNGSLVRVVLLHGGIYSDPVALASNGTDVWVTDQGGGIDGIGSVVELNAATGAVVRIIGG